MLGKEPTDDDVELESTPAPVVVEPSRACSSEAMNEQALRALHENCDKRVPLSV